MSRQVRADETVADGSHQLRQRNPSNLKALVVMSCLVAAGWTLWAGRDSRARDLSRVGESMQQKVEQPQRSAGPGRFDNKVRENFFAGFAGDAAALEQGMKMCEEALAKDPRDAPALVWHGSGLMFRSGQAFRKGDFKQGRDLWQRGLNEMDDAVALQPADVQVLIPRGATLLNDSRYAQQPEEMKNLLSKGLGDYEAVLKIQTPYFSQLPLHSRGELLFGLADGWYRLGDTVKARSYFNRLVTEAAGSGRDKQAAEVLKTGELPKNTSCVGCHR